jgi:hypothetical protein
MLIIEKTSMEPMDQYPAFQAVPKFDQLARLLKLRIDGTPLKRQSDLLRAMYQDIAALGFEQANATWKPRLPVCNQARIDLERFVEAVEPLKALPGLKKRILDNVIPWSITQDFTTNDGKPFFYELEVASAVKLAGFHVELREPDVVVSGKGLSKPVALACKYPISRQQLTDHVTGGYKQIERQKLNGAVCIGLDLLVGSAVDPDFRNGKAFEDQFWLLVKEVNDLVKSRREDYPEERPLDGLMMTLSIVGFGHEGTERVESSTLGCLSQNPMRKDLELIRQGINAIRGV